MATNYTCKKCKTKFYRYNTVSTLCPKCAALKYTKKRKAIKKIGKQTDKWMQFRREWIRKTPPPYICYLQITPQCPVVLKLDTLTLDHVIPRSGDPTLRYNSKNIKPACHWCNSKKGSKRLENLK